LTRLSYLMIASLMALSLLQSGCGRKAWPRAAQSNNQMTVLELKTYRQGEEGIIEGVLMGLEEGKGAGQDFSGFRIYHTAFPLSAEPCEGCPIQYTDVSDQRAKLDEAGRFLIELGGLKKGEVHFFELRVLGADGSLGPSSTRVKLIRASNK